MIPAVRFGSPEGGHTAYERIPPVGDVDSECRFDFGLVEYRKVRPLHLGRKFRRVAGTDLTGGMVCQCGDFMGEIEPRADSFVREVVEALPSGIVAGFDAVEDHAGQGGGAGRSSHLIENDL